MKKIVLSNKQSVILLIVIISIIIAIFYLFSKIAIIHYNNYISENEAIKIYDLNKDCVFKISSINIFSSVYATDNTSDNSMKDINISQFSDIAIQIDNTSTYEELNNTNTVKSVEIQDIKIYSDDDENITGEMSLTYKDPNLFGKYVETEASKLYTRESTKYANIVFDPIYTNEDASELSNPLFYTDCSNPICLTYINKNIIENQKVPDNTNIDLNGLLLKHLNYPTQNLKVNLEFIIKITNNNCEEFSYLVKLPINPDASHALTSVGYSYQGKVFNSNTNYNFTQYK